MRVTHLDSDYLSHYGVVRIYVKEGDEPVQHALVTGIVSSPNGGSTKIGVFTDSDGIATCRVHITQRGDYSYRVVSLAHDDHVYEADENRVESVRFAGIEAFEVSEEEAEEAETGELTDEDDNGPVTLVDVSTPTD